MSTFSPLSLLKNILAAAASSPSVELRRSDAIDKVLTQLQAAAKADGQSHVSKDLQAEAVQRFWHTKQLTSLRDARLVSFGLGLDAWEDGRCLLEEQALFRTALNEIDQWRDTPRQFRKCYQGLVRSYFDYDGMVQDPASTGRKNSTLLRTYLQQNIGCIQNDQSINPDWVECATQNPSLFSDKPGHAYGQELLQDNSERVDSIRRLMGIADASWFTRALLIGQVEAATQQGDATFQKLLSRLLQRIADNSVVRDQGLRLILERYVGLAQVPLHEELKECAAQWWGNPWLPSNRSQWGGVSEAAQSMVSQWLTSEFIDLFFTLLAEDGSGDSRRVKFWQQYVPSITHIRFALGREVMQSRDKDFINLREKLKGLIVVLDDSVRSNNAFIMGMGDLIAIEFSNQANAFYAYSQKNPLPFDLTTPVRSSPVNGPNSLKNSRFIFTMDHTDSISKNLLWENKFEKKLKEEFSIFPQINCNVDADKNFTQLRLFKSEQAQTKILKETKLPPSTNQEYSTLENQKKPQSISDAPILIPDIIQKKIDLELNIKDLAGMSSQKSSLPFEEKTAFSIENIQLLADHTKSRIINNIYKGGVLWFCPKKFNMEVARILTRWGFKYSSGKGWWKG